MDITDRQQHALQHTQRRMRRTRRADGLMPLLLMAETRTTPVHQR
jgi:hypothetical protein